MDAVEKVAATVLYEGYLLWPYRRSALKNQKRWTFGGVFPRAFSEAAQSGDPWEMQTECLVCGAAPAIAVCAKFLQAVERRVGRPVPDGGVEFVDALQVGSERYVPWQEARERELRIDALELRDLAAPRRFPISIPAGQDEETLVSPDGGRPGVLARVGVLVRSWASCEGAVEVSAREVGPSTFRVTIRITNETPWTGGGREAALDHSFLSTHTIVEAIGGNVVSLTDPPESLRDAAAACRNLHTWPVLAGQPGDTRYLLSSPIILPDYPQIAPESKGDLFDSTEIDQLLFLNTLALTDAEKQEIRATDPRVRELLDRTESLTMNDFMQMHGAIREFRMLRPDPAVGPELSQMFETLETLETPAPESVLVDGVELRKGSKVRLRPGPRGDIWDIALAGKLAFIEAIEEDYDGQVHFAVTVEDDPGRDLGEARLVGHRFFFKPGEVEPVLEGDVHA
jgi:hypothetical protein